MKSDCNGLFGFTAPTASAPAVTVRLTGTDDMSGGWCLSVRMAMGDERWLINDGCDWKKSAHASKVTDFEVVLSEKKFGAVGRASGAGGLQDAITARDLCTG